MPKYKQAMLKLKHRGQGKWNDVKFRAIRQGQLFHFIVEINYINQVDTP